MCHLPSRAFCFPRLGPWLASVACRCVTLSRRAMWLTPSRRTRRRASLKSSFAWMARLTVEGEAARAPALLPAEQLQRLPRRSRPGALMASSLLVSRRLITCLFAPVAWLDCFESRLTSPVESTCHSMCHAYSIEASHPQSTVNAEDQMFSTIHATSPAIVPPARHHHGNTYIYVRIRVYVSATAKAAITLKWRPQGSSARRCFTNSTSLLYAL